MELIYEVIIDTKQAEKATGNIVKIFEQLGKSTDKDIKDIARFGNEIVAAMKDGKISAAEAETRINSLRDVTLKFLRTGRYASDQSKKDLGVILNSVGTLKASVKQLDRLRQQAHEREIINQKREQEEIKRTEKLEKRRSSVTSRAGRFVRASTRANLSVGSLAGMARFGVAGIAVGGVVGIVKKFIDSYKGVFNFDALRDTLDRFKYVLDNFVAKFVTGGKVDADENLYNTKVNRWRGEYEQSKKDIETMHKTETNAVELSEAFERLKKAVPSFGGMKDFTELVKGDQQTQLKAVQEAYDKQLKGILKQLVKEPTETAEYKAYKNKAEKADKAWADVQKFEERKNKSPKELALLEEMRAEARRATAEKKKAEEKYTSSEAYKLYEQERNAIVERISKENKVSHYLKDLAEAQKKAVEAEKAKREALKELGGIAPQKAGESYGEMLVNANEWRKKQMGKIAPYANSNDKDIQTAVADATRRVEAETKRMYEEANNVVRELMDEVNSRYQSATSSALEKEIREIKQYYDELTKEVETLIGDIDDMAENAKGILKESEAIEIENAKLRDNIEKIEEAAEARADAIESGERYKSDYERETELIEAQKEAINEKVKAYREQKNISEDERNEIAKLIAMLSKLQNQEKRTREEMERYYQEMRKNAIGEGFAGVAGALSSSSNGYVSAFGNAMSSYGQVSELREAMRRANMIENADERRQAQRTAKVQGYSTAAQAVVKFGMDTWEAFADSAKQSREALDEWNAKVADSAHKLVMLDLEKWEYQQRNVFGIDDPYAKLGASIKKESEAQKEAAKALAKMANEGIVQVGTKKKAEGKTIAQLAASGMGSGALIGAAAGSAGSPVGTIIGAAAGAITGAIAGIFAGRKEVAVYDSLRNKYGNLYDMETLEINKQILADYDKMDDATKRLIDNAKELLEVQKDARQEYQDYISELVGQMGTEIRDVLYNAFKDKKIFDAIDGIKEYTAETMGNILQQKAFDSVFGNLMDGMDREMKNIYDENGQLRGDLAEIMASYVSLFDKGIIDYNNLMEQIQEKFKGYGIDPFQGGTDTQEALQGAISGMSEETAGKINGNFMGLKLATLDVSDKVGDIRNLLGDHSRLVNRANESLTEIAENTRINAELVAQIRDFTRKVERDGVMVR